MTGEGRSTTPDVAGASDVTGVATLVVGEHEHDSACRQLADSASGGVHGIRVTTNADGNPSADTDAYYDTGVYDGLSLPEAGIVVSDSIDNALTQRHSGGAESFVVCVDALPEPTSERERERLFRFLHGLTSRIRETDGACHAHLDVDPDAPLAKILAPLFDDVVAAGAEQVSGAPS